MARMIGSEDIDEQLNDSAFGSGEDTAGGDYPGVSDGPYDPLFESWLETQRDESAVVDEEGLLWLDDSAAWQPAVFEDPPPQHSYGTTASSPQHPWLPHPAPPLSTLQQEARHEPTAKSRRSARTQGIQVALIGLALLLLGVITAANGLDTATTELKLATYGALISGALLTSAGIAGATLGVPLPLPGFVTVREIAETVLLAMLIFLAVRASFQNFKVEGASMQPSLHNDQYLIVNKLSYAGVDLSIFNFLPLVDAAKDDIFHIWDSPSRGDVIVFHAPQSPGRDFIKRIIGMPGDTIEINSSTGQVAVNGNFLEEDYIQGTTNCNVSCTWTVPPADSEQARSQCGSNACYFVLGDNRQNSSDSRGGWLVPEENIIGKALITYWDNGEVNVDLAPNHSVHFASEAAAQE